MRNESWHRGVGIGWEFRFGEKCRVARAKDNSLQPTSPTAWRFSSRLSIPNPYSGSLMMGIIVMSSIRALPHRVLSLLTAATCIPADGNARTSWTGSTSRTGSTGGKEVTGDVANRGRRLKSTGNGTGSGAWKVVGRSTSMPASGPRSQSNTGSADRRDPTKT